MKSPTAMSRFIRGIVENSGPPNDGRPFATDLYLVMLLAACDDMYDMREGCKAWVEGDWDTALEMLTLKDLPEEYWPLKPRTIKAASCSIRTMTLTHP